MGYILCVTTAIRGYSNDGYFFKNGYGQRLKRRP